MRKLNFILPFILCLLYLTSIAFAASPLDSVKNGIADFLGIPQDLMATDKVFRFVILPFLAVFVAVLGIMRDIRMFRRTRLDVALAIIITFIVLPWSKAMGWWILWLYGSGAFLAVTAVGGMFLIGIIFWALGRWFFWRGGLSAVKNINKEIDGLRKDRLHWEVVLAEAMENHNIKKATEARNHIAEIDEKVRQRRETEFA